MVPTLLTLALLQAQLLTPAPTVTTTQTPEPTPTTERHHARGLAGPAGTSTAAAIIVQTVWAREAAFPRIYLPLTVRPRLRAHTALLPLVVRRR